MAWSASKIFTSYVTDVVNRVTNGPKINTDTMEMALFNNSATPDQTVTSANSAYGVGVWSANGVTDTGSSAPAGWPALGRPLGTISSTFTTNVYTYTAANTVSANAVTTLTNAFGCLIYDHTSTAVTDQGVCFLYFGGAQTVTLGTFTVVPNASGLFTLTL
jgi:hypothetical protein